MKSTIFDIMQRQGLRLSLCALAFGFSTATMYAQDEAEESTGETFKAPVRRTAADKNPVISLSGVVLDNATKSPIAGVRVQTFGDNRYAAMTNAKGEFTIKVPTFATSLFVEAPRYMSQQVAITAGDEKQNIRICMLNEKFGVMYDGNTVYSAQNSFTAKGGGVILDDEIQQNLGADIRTINRSGIVDGGNAMFIRGLNSLNANAQPLIIIDGVEYDMQQNRSTLHDGQSFNVLSTFSPEDIDKVTVLKNGTALYGARGANGVILIDTKRGHSMATRIDANISAGVTLRPRTQTVMNAAQYRNYATEMLGTVPDMLKAENRDIEFKFLNDDPNKFYYHTYHNDTDWRDFVYREALTQNYNINVQGGDDIGMYNLSVGYLTSEASVKESDFDRLNVRFNTDIKILWNLTTKFDMSFSRTNNNVFDDGIPMDLAAGSVTSPTFLSSIKSPLLYPNQYNNYVGGFTELLSDWDDLYSPLSRAMYENEYGFSLANPVSILKNGHGDNKNRLENTFFNVHIAPTFEFNPHLHLTTQFSYTLDRNSQRYYRPYTGVPPYLIEGVGRVYAKTASLFAKETNVLSNTHIDWNNRFGAHTIAATGGFRYNYFSFNSNDLSTQFKGQTNDKNPYLTASIDDGYASVGGADDVWKNLQWYATGNYSYANRYFATVSLLAEANSRFGAKAEGGVSAFGTQWAIFPSVQLGWVVSNESWFPKNSGIDYLRVNAGFDMSGNDDISNYAARTSFSAVRYNYQAIGAQMTNIGNDKIKWETTSKFNVGVQANMLNNRLSANLDYYIHQTCNLLTLQSFNNPIAGINKYWTNGGTLENQGFEAAISGKPVAGRNWTLEVGASVGHYMNKVKELPAQSVADGVVKFSDGTFVSSLYGTNNIITKVGSSIAQFYGYQTNGVFATDGEAQGAGNGGYLYMVDHAGNHKDFTAGDVWFVDQNGDGEINEKDKVVIGDPNPDIYGNIFATLTYKNFTLNVGFNYSLGNDVFNYQRSILNSGSNFYNQQVAEIGHWRYEGQQTNIPKLAFGDPMGNNRFSDRWIEDGSYLRLKNVRLAYQIPVPDSWTSWLQGLSVWGEAQNVFTLTHYTGCDPEFSVGNSVFSQGIDCGNVAHSRSFVLGLKINL